MEHGGDTHDIVVEPEEDAVVAGAKAKGAGQAAMQGANVTAAGSGVVENGLEDAHGRDSVNLPDIGLGRVLPIDTVGKRHYFLSGKSAIVRPKSARTSSMGTPLPPLAQ